MARVPVGRDPHVIFVEKADVFDAYGLKESDSQAIYVIRPDGYVAWRGDGPRRGLPVFPGPLRPRSFGPGRNPLERLPGLIFVRFPAQGSWLCFGSCRSA